MMVRGYSHALSEFIPYTKRNRRYSGMYQLCRHVINRSVITTCRSLHTYECITLLLINLPGTYFSITNSSATLNSCSFSSFYSNIDSNMLRSSNICSFHLVSGKHIAQRTTWWAPSNSWPYQGTAFASLTDVLFCISREEFKILFVFPFLKGEDTLCITCGISNVF